MISKVADVVEITEKLGVKVDWIDRIFEEITRKKKSLTFKQLIQTWEAQIFGLKKQRHVEYKLADLHTNMLM